MGEAGGARLLDVIEDGVDAEAALGFAWIEERIDQAQAVAEHIDQSGRGELAALRAGGIAIFDDVRAHRGLLDHRRVVGEAHVGHAALGVARIQIAAQQPELLFGRFGRAQAAREIGVARHDLAPAPRELETLHRHARRDASLAAVAGGAVGDVLRAAETGIGQHVVQLPASSPSSAVKTLRSRLPGKYGQGDGAVRKNRRFLVGKGLRHACAYWSPNLSRRQATRAQHSGERMLNKGISARFPHLRRV